MARLAAQVRGPRVCALPPLLALTDPERTPDPVALASRLPRGSGLIYRHFGAPSRYETGARLAGIAAARGLVLLVSADADLADAIGAQGVHWPESRLPEAYRRRARGDNRLFSTAAHSPRRLLRARDAGIDAALFSPVFPSSSPSAGRAKGHFPSSAAVRAAGMPVYALGGIDLRSAKRLEGLGFSGIACVGATTGAPVRSAARTRT